MLKREISVYMKPENTKGILPNVLLGLLVCGLTAIISSWIISIYIPREIDFNLTGLSDGLIAFHTSAVIAIFLALFHSENRRITSFRNSSKAGSLLYFIVVLNAILVVITPLFLDTGISIFEISLNILVTTFSLTLTAQTTYYLFLLVRLFMKQQA